MYNYSNKNLKDNITSMIDVYNEERIKKNKTSLNMDNKKISWSAGLKTKINQNIIIKYNSSKIIKTIYRPFCKQNLYYDSDLIERPGVFEKLFLKENKLICVSGVGANKEFSCLIVDNIPSLDTIEKNQCFPLYWYDEDNESLFSKTKEHYIKYDGISDYIFNKFSEKFQKHIEKEDIFYYVYGILHSKIYREKYKADLKKSLPRIPIVDTYEKFLNFVNAGKKLADLHLNYETIAPYKKCEIIKNKENFKVTKMKFGKNKDKSIIEFNDNIIIKNIPSKAYEYVVNGKSAIEWIMERYAITTDKKSGIINDPNDWCREVNDEKYIFNLLLRVINVSVKTIDIVNSLPKLNFDE